ncbi:putative uncharacterized protein DDB_G0271606 [Armigeres subalbatus]|uniref:putative uncharacterized protein DDB_G0271606 n=1 Tax=Armigeres subalbatus TaxID=124917 RepID=UPI002ED01209
MKMELNHLTPEEIDFELLVRKTTGTRGKNLEWKTSQLQQLLESEFNGSPVPNCSSHVLTDMDSIYQCQTKLAPILQALEGAFRQRNNNQVNVLKSRLLHYQFRLSLISDPMILMNAKKTLEKVGIALRKIEKYNQEQASGTQEQGQAENLPSDPETLKRLKITKLQSSIKETSNHQLLLEKQLQEELQSNQMSQQQTLNQDPVLFDEPQQQQQQQQQHQNSIREQQHQFLQQLPQQFSVQPSQPHPHLQQQEQQNRGFYQEQSLRLLLNQMQIQQQQLEQQLQQEQYRRQQLEMQLQNLQSRVTAPPQRENDAPNYTFGAISGYWGPYNQRDSGIAEQPQEFQQRNFRETPDRSYTPRFNTQQTNSYRFLQPVHKWPFEYSGEGNIVKLGEFLNQVNTYAVTEGMDDQTLLRSIKHLLKGRALQWYTRSYLNLTSWDIFKAEIKQEFLPPNYSEIVKQDLYLRFQGPNEPFTAFYRDLVAAFEIVEPTISESEKLFILKSHLNTDFSPIASASRSASIRDLVAVCKDFEVSRSYALRGRAPTISRALGSRHDTPVLHRSTNSRFDNNGRPPLSRQPYGSAVVSIMEHSQDFEEELDPVNIREREALQQDIAYRNENASNITEEVSAIRGQNNWSGRSALDTATNQLSGNSIREAPIITVCWQCENPGHTYLRCPNPKRFLFCYSCGKKGCTTRNCEACILRWKQLEAQNAPSISGNRNWENPQ